MDFKDSNDSGALTHISSILARADFNGKLPEPPRVMTGFTELDEQLNGLHSGDLIAAAARPGMGSTAFALNIALGAAKRDLKRRICLFGLSASEEEIADRLLSIATAIPVPSQRTEALTLEQNEQLGRSAEMLGKSGIYIDCPLSLGIEELRSKLRPVEELGLVIIDDLRLMSGGARSDSIRARKLTQNVRGLKALARELNVPVFVTLSISRDCERRQDKRPLLLDLRREGAIEQYADVVMFLYRDSYYNRESPADICECIVAKNRHGAVGTVPLGWDGSCSRFTNV